MIDTAVCHYFFVDSVPSPVRCVPQWWRSLWGRQILLNIGQYQRQLMLGQRMGQTVFVINRNGFSPIALTAKYRIAQSIIDPSFSAAMFFQMV